MIAAGPCIFDPLDWAARLDVWLADEEPARKLEYSSLSSSRSSSRYEGSSIEDFGCRPFVTFDSPEAIKAAGTFLLFLSTLPREPATTDFYTAFALSTFILFGELLTKFDFGVSASFVSYNFGIYFEALFESLFLSLDFFDDKTTGFTRFFYDYVFGFNCYYLSPANASY